MPKVTDISFDCPHCHGPLMADSSHVGMTCDCPHCYAQFQVPDGSEVNKDKFVEPQGLRRVLKQVRDQEWEMLRRKLRAAKAHSAELEVELIRVQAALAERSATPKQSDENAASGEPAEQLRKDLEAARLEVAAANKKNEELTLQLQSASGSASVAQTDQSKNLVAEVERLKRELSEVQGKLEVEQAKVMLMEAAGVSAEFPVNGEQGSETQNETFVQELQEQIAELRKANDSLRAARDKVHAELVALKDQMTASADEDLELQMALSNLEDGMSGVLELITARRSPRVQKA